MGLLSSIFGGGGSKASTSNATTNTDNSINLADSELTQLGEGAVMADTVGSVNRDSNNLNIAGANNTVNQFGDNAAQVVRSAIDTLGSVTSKNLQLYTEKNLLADNLKAESQLISLDEIKNLLSQRSFQIGLVAAGGVAFWIFKRKRNK